MEYERDARTSGGTEININDIKGLDQSLLSNLNVGDDVFRIVSQENINFMMNQANVLNKDGGIIRKDHILAALDAGFGVLDFSATQLWTGSGIAGDQITSVSEADSTTRFFIFGDQAFNIMDAGNYLTGYALRTMMFSESEIVLGANLFARMMHGVNDSSADIRALRAGIRASSSFNHIKPHDFKMSKPSFINTNFTPNGRRIY